MNATELRRYVLDALHEGRALGNADMPKAATPYSVKRVTAQLLKDGEAVTRLLPGGKVRLFFKDDKIATQYLREYAKNLTPRIGSIKFAPDADVVVVPPPSVGPSARYNNLSDAHIHGSGYTASV